MTSQSPRREGFALLLAMLVLALAAALVIGATSTARSMARTQLAREMSLASDGAARQALVTLVATWDPGNDSMRIGSSTARHSAVGPIRVDIQLRRMSDRRFAAVASTSAGDGPNPIGRRRLTILLDKPLEVDSLAPTIRPKVLARWGIADIY